MKTDKPDQYDKRDMEILCSISEQVAIAIDRKRGENALRESEHRFREMANLLPLVICELDLEMKITYANQAGLEIFGLSSSDFDRRGNVLEFIAPNDRNKFKEWFEAVVNGQKFEEQEFQFLRKDGSSIITLVKSLRMKKENLPIGVQLSILDVTHRKTLEAQLQKAQKMEAIGTLAGGIAHNFNNLLMGIQGNATLMLLETDPNHTFYDRLKNIEQQIKNGAELTNQLLNYAREGAYKIKLTDLNLLIKKTSETIAMTRKDISLHMELHGELWHVNVDKGQIEQLLLNLFINAVEAMPKGGNLYIKTKNVSYQATQRKPVEIEAGDYIRLIIEDTGIGMDKKTIKRIFEPFFTTKEQGKGTGLGLASVYGIVKGHGGYIHVKSNQGEKTTFEIYMPAHKRKIVQKENKIGDIIKGDGTVLLVDDDETIIEVGQNMLRVIGYDVLIASNGKEAIEKYKQYHENIQIVILDMIMPEMNGSDTYDRLKEINPDIKVLLSSGYNKDGMAAEILNRGCNGFIQKPFHLKELSLNLFNLVEN